MYSEVAASPTFTYFARSNILIPWVLIVVKITFRGHFKLDFDVKNKIRSPNYLLSIIESEGICQFFCAFLQFSLLNNVIKLLKYFLIYA